MTSEKPYLVEMTLVEGIRDYTILALLSDGYNVIVDGCHLRPQALQHIKDLVKGKAKVSIRHFVHSYINV